MPPYVPTALTRTITRSLGRFGDHATGRLLAHARRYIRHSGLVTTEAMGFRWELDTSDQLQRQLYYAGTYDSVTRRSLLPETRQSDTVLDVGANIGVVTLPLARLCARVIAVEPDQVNIARLHVHLQMNHLEHRVTVIPEALGRVDTRALLRKLPRAPTDATRTLHGTGEVVGTVPVVTGDSLLERLGVERVDILKIDVDGGDFDVLQGLTGLFDSSPPRLVVLEVIDDIAQMAGHRASDLTGFMDSYGYNGWAIRLRGEQPIGDAGGFSGNVIFRRARR